MGSNIKGKSLYESKITKLLKNLWIGSAPPVGDTLEEMGIDVLWLCAEEYQPGADQFPGVKVHHFPNQDHGQPITDAKVDEVFGEAKTLANEIRSGKNVLVTCRMGLVRSATMIVAAMKILHPEKDLDQLITDLREKRSPMVLNSANWVGALHRMFKD